MSESSAAAAAQPKTTPSLFPSHILGDDKKTVALHQDLMTKEYNYARCVAFYPKTIDKSSVESSELLLVGYSNTIKLWDVNKKKIVYTFDCGSSQAQFVCWHPSGNYFAAALGDRSVLIYQPKDPKPKFTLRNYGLAVLTSLKFSEDGTELLLADCQGNIQIYNTETEPFTSYEPIKLKPPNAGLNVAHVQFDTDGGILFSNRESIFIFSLDENGETHYDLERKFESPVTLVECKGANKIYGSEDELIINGKTIKGIGAVAASFNDDGKLVAVIDYNDDAFDGVVKIIDVSTGKLLHVLGKVRRGDSISWVGNRIAYCHGQHVNVWSVQDTKATLETLVDEVYTNFGKYLPPDSISANVMGILGTDPSQLSKIGKYTTSAEANPQPSSLKALPPPPPSQVNSGISAELPPPPPAPQESLMSPPVKSRRLEESKMSEYNQITPEYKLKQDGQLKREREGGKTKRKRRSKTTKKLITKKKRSLRIKRK
jgi:WD40 repeat protein